LKEITTLTGKAQFGLVYDRGKALTSKELVVRMLPNNLGITRYGLTVSRRIGKAVVRNKIKRRLREILRKTGLKPGWDIIIIARNTAASADFTTLGRSVENLLMKAGLTAGEHEADSTGAD
jgi:ribonuclease P protein component